MPATPQEFGISFGRRPYSPIPRRPTSGAETVSQSLTMFYAHLVFSTRNRYPFLDSEIHRSPGQRPRNSASPEFFWPKAIFTNPPTPRLRSRASDGRLAWNWPGGDYGLRPNAGSPSRVPAARPQEFWQRGYGAVNPAHLADADARTPPLTPSLPELARLGGPRPAWEFLGPAG